MAQHHDKFLNLLRELFQMDQADLDFGIYRIMNAKREEIESYLTNDLMPQANEILSRTVDTTGTQELDEAIKQATDLGVDPETVPRVKELREKYGDGPDLTSLEYDVFSHLYSFFRRYYKEGDFISQRRYKKDVYAIPYEGEEVKLHWANHDQYYIKTAENFKDYSFKLADGRRVHFKLVEATTEQDNKKETAGKERRFIIREIDSVAEENDEFFIYFEFRPDDEKRKQETLNARTVEKVFSYTDHISWLAGLEKKAPTEKKPNRTLLEKHLANYTAKNSFDYFIHKDLGGFLKRELDFYIKNEVMHLDDIENESAQRVEQYLSVIKAIRQIAHKIIRFLAQIEDFQKKLWLKKKFVVETNYCVTLDRVPEELYPEICGNEGQIEEWKSLFSIDSIQPVDGTLLKKVQKGFTEPMCIEFLKEHPLLIIDTAFYDKSFKRRLLHSINRIDDRLNGLAIKGECYQAMNLLENTFREQIKCTYIDPPYNMVTGDFQYKDSYRHSSWLAFLNQSLFKLKQLLNSTGLIGCSIDDNEVVSIGFCMTDIFGEQNKLAYAPWKAEPSGGKQKTGIRNGHEYLVLYSKGSILNISREKIDIGDFEFHDDQGQYIKGRELRKWGDASLRTDRPKQFFALKAPDNSKVLPYRNDGKEGRWRWGKDHPIMREAVENPNVLHWEKTEFDKGVLINGANERWDPFEKIRDTNRLSGWGTWLDKHGTNAEATKSLKELFGKKEFDTPKPLALVKWLTQLNADLNGIIMDFFAGSGTTAHAAIDLNREDDGKRRFIVIEMNEHFNTILKPRILKSFYSEDWKDGSPLSHKSGVSCMLKYARIESYEDALNNLELKRTDQQQTALDLADANVKEAYLLSYMLDIETKGSTSLLNIEKFRDPWNYKLKITRNNETKETPVDLVETFNYLIGLHVNHIDFIRGIQVIDGKNRADEKILVLWRNIDETDNDTLNNWFEKQDYNTKDQEYDIVYINGDNNLENLRRADQTWKVRMIEPEFQRLMFDVEDV